MKLLHNYVGKVFSIVLVLALTACGGTIDDEEAGPEDPVITLLGSSNVTVLVGEEYVELGATAKDKDGVELNVVISGEVDTTEVGVYVVTYNAVDSEARSASAERIVSVENPRPFTTVWDTRNGGVTADNQIMIDTEGEGFEYSVDWGDGSESENVQGDVVHTYQIPGIYTVKILGDFPHFIMADVTENNFEDATGNASEAFIFESDNHKLLAIEDWGNIRWHSMASMFVDAINLQIDTDTVPNLSSVTDLSRMFRGTQDIDHNFADWDVSSITSMRAMFSNSSFNQDISGWDVSSVTNMEGMFAGASTFNQDIGDWEVENVTNMNNMFSGAIVFNQDISEWNVSNVTSMVSMFGSNVDFDYLEDIGWGALGTTYIPRPGASLFNQDISEWDVSSVTSMRNMFTGATNFNQDLSEWDVSSVTSMHSMFAQASAFNQDISDWDVANVRHMSFMFMQTIFNQDLSEWDTGEVVYMNRMFSEAEAFDQNLGDWDVTEVLEMEFMFHDIALSTANYTALLQGWGILELQREVTFDAGESQYSLEAVFARENMVDQYEWEITDGGRAN